MLRIQSARATFRPLDSLLSRSLVLFFWFIRAQQQNLPLKKSSRALFRRGFLVFTLCSPFCFFSSFRRSFHCYSLLLSSALLILTAISRGWRLSYPSLLQRSLPEDFSAFQGPASEKRKRLLLLLLGFEEDQAGHGFREVQCKFLLFLRYLFVTIRSSDPYSKCRGLEFGFSWSPPPPPGIELTPYSGGRTDPPRTHCGGSHGRRPFHVSCSLFGNRKPPAPTLPLSSPVLVISLPSPTCRPGFLILMFALPNRASSRIRVDLFFFFFLSRTGPTL